ncbi:hypothetical protein J2I47_07640 [Fibrella sp. HMF5335]|uniref:UbiA prenyltransferase family protein n=1 Tax=Fibrella rubiginis TaxID=2817060 RepID=A0A939GCA1_9BACT|nr:hypothetical protein [Fibrella rubiginis]MBO0936417.1 hypothetical protein [Fibrella rubiginis]
MLKTAYLAAIWTYTTAALPILMASSPVSLSTLLWSAWLANRFLFIYAVCLWFDYRDRPDDGQSRWLTIVSMLTEPQIDRFFGSIVLLFSAATVAFYVGGVGGWVVICISLPMLLLILTARWVTKRLSDYWYYVYLDGLVMLTGLLLPILPV